LSEKNSRQLCDVLVYSLVISVFFSYVFDISFVLKKKQFIQVY